jgi:hypothetical protein
MKLSGHLDLCGYPLIEGWLHCDVAEERPIRLQVYIDEDLVGECVADIFRKDLQEAGYGTGHCGFSFSVPQEYSAGPFAGTRLRFVDAPVYLLSDQSTVVQS